MAFFPGSSVQVLGAKVGTIDAVEIDRDRVRVRFTVDADVPLPDDVNAAIVPLTLIGERNLVLYPAWNDQMEAQYQAGQIGRLADGAEIPLERTHLPVEPDEALGSFTQLAKSLDPDTVRELVSSGAAAVKDRGATFNAVLERGAMMTSTLAAVDDQLLGTVQNVHQVAASLTTRQQQLATIIDSFAQISGVLAEQRDEVVGLLDSVARLPQAGLDLLSTYGDQLPGDIAALTRLLLTTEANVGSLEQVFAAQPDLFSLLLGAYRPDLGLLQVRGTLAPTVATIVGDALGTVGLDGLVCVILPNACVPSGASG